MSKNENVKAMENGVNVSTAETEKATETSVTDMETAVTVNTTEPKTTENTPETEIETETESDNDTIKPVRKIISGLDLRRERYRADGKEYWGYFVEGAILGKKKRAALSAPDKDRGGFDLLDTIFEDKKAIDIALVPYEMRDKVTNKITQKGFKFEGFTLASDGLTYCCNIKPRSPSDKSLLDVFLRQKGIEVAQ